MRLFLEDCLNYIRGLKKHENIFLIVTPIKGTVVNRACPGPYLLNGWSFEIVRTVLLITNFFFAIFVASIICSTDTLLSLL